MHILALETSGRVGSVALLEFDPAAGVAGVRIVQQRILPADEPTARTLIPHVQQLLTDNRRPLSDVGLVCVASGPGSFTGLRIGVVAAKTLAYALDAPLAAVHTLAAIAEGVEDAAAATDGGRRDAQRLWTVLDAQRRELFVASFDAGQNLAASLPPATEVIGVDAWRARLVPGDRVAGPPLAKWPGQLPAGVAAVDPSLWSPTAAAVGRLGARLAQQGIHANPMALVPNYYRRSAAEEKAAPLRAADDAAT